MKVPKYRKQGGRKNAFVEFRGKRYLLLWRPRHKTEYVGREIIVPIGPQCQAVLEPPNYVFFEIDLLGRRESRSLLANSACSGNGNAQTADHISYLQLCCLPSSSVLVPPPFVRYPASETHDQPGGGLGARMRNVLPRRSLYGKLPS